MATWDETIPKKPSRYLKPEMIGFDRTLVLTIDRVSVEPVDYNDGKGEQQEVILYWREGILGQCHPQSIALKGLKTNVTHRKALKEIFGPDQESCIGRKVRLTIDVGQMPGKTYKTIVLGYAGADLVPNPWLVNDVGEFIGEIGGGYGGAQQGGVPQGGGGSQQGGNGNGAGSFEGDTTFPFGANEGNYDPQAVLNQSANTPIRQ